MAPGPDASIQIPTHRGSWSARCLCPRCGLKYSVDRLLTFPVCSLWVVKQRIYSITSAEMKIVDEHSDETNYGISCTCHVSAAIMAPPLPETQQNSNHGTPGTALDETSPRRCPYPLYRRRVCQNMYHIALVICCHNWIVSDNR